VKLKSTARLGLGAAQRDLDYRAPGGRGRMSPAEAAATLQVAVEAGMRVLDTGAETGQAPALLAAGLPPASPFKVTVKTARAADGVEAVEAQARASLQRLGLERADALVVDCAADLLGPQGPALWKMMRRLKDEGLYDRIGVSANPEDHPLALARRFKPDLMQLPFSLLDQRLAVDGVLGEIAGMRIDINLRSIFLQGLLFLPRDGLPPRLAEAGPRLSRIRRMIAEAGADPMQAALAFALGRPEASAVIVGVASAAELRAIVAATAAAPPVLDWQALALDHAIALDPQRWAAA
jgi:aryl-alcohol dehydrogenase-like predicted oxidoreductase